MMPGCVGTEETTEPPWEIHLVYPPTEVGGYRMLNEWVDPEEAEDIIATFRWEDTEELPEIAPDGTHTFFYMLMQMTGPGQQDLLDEAYVPWGIVPFFDVDHEPLPDEPVVLSGSSGGGGWLFTFLSGEQYNIIRAAGLAGEPMFGAVVEREAPLEFTLPSGSIDVAALAQAGFRWPERRPEDVEEPATPGVSVAAITEIITDAVADFVHAGVEALADAERFWGATIDFFRPNAAVTLALRVATPDADFVPAATGGFGTVVAPPLRRTWGPERGLPIPLTGQRVIAYIIDQGARGRFDSTLNAGNAAGFSLPSGVTYQFCTLNSFNGGDVMDFWVTTQTCTGGASLGFNSPGGTVFASFAEQNLQTIVVARDGIEYVNSQLTLIFQGGLRMPVIATGQMAEILAFGQNGFVVGLGGRDIPSRIASTMLDGIVAAAPIVGLASVGIPVPPEVSLAIAALRPGYNVDIVWPGGNPSRVVFAHELGHHIFYQLMAMAGNFIGVPGTPPTLPFHYGSNLMFMILSSLFGGIGAPGGLPPPGTIFFEPVAINEGFADFFGAQLSGGGNRIPNIPGTYPGDAVGRGPGGRGVGEVYCDPTAGAGGGGCFDFNYLGSEGTAGFGAQVNDEATRISTLLTDVIDDFLIVPVGPEHSGMVWARTTGCGPGRFCPSANVVVAGPGPTGGLADDPIALPLLTVIGAIWSWQLSVEGFVPQTNAVMRGMTRALRASGVPDATSCILYSAHTPPPGVCPPAWLATP